MTWDSPSFPPEPDPGSAPGRAEPGELVGIHLRMSGVMTLGRFSRLSDTALRVVARYRRFRSSQT